MSMRLGLRLLSSLALSAALPMHGAQAAEGIYPSRPIRLLLGFPPGGSTDFLARSIGEQLGLQLGQTVVVDNRPGAGSNIAAEMAAKAPADGHHLLLSSGSHTLAPSIYPKLGYDLMRDFTHITQLVDAPMVLVANVQVPARTMPELVAYVRARPGTVSYASSGVGTPSHLGAEMIRQAAGLEVTHVPYKGAVPATVDLLAGRVAYYVTTIPGVLGHLRGGKLRAIAITGARRSSVLAEVPTVEESGLKGVRAGSWYGLSFPRGVPPAIVTRMHTAAQRGLTQSDLKARLNGDGMEVIEGMSSEQFTQHVRDEMARWAEVVKRAGTALNP